MLVFIIVVAALFASWKLIAFYRRTGQRRYRRWAASAMWGCVGAFIGSSAGIAAGPWGAIAGTIPGFAVAFLIASNSMKVDSDDGHNSAPVSTRALVETSVAVPATTTSIPSQLPNSHRNTGTGWLIYILMAGAVAFVAFLLMTPNTVQPVPKPATPPPSPPASAVVASVSRPAAASKHSRHRLPTPQRNQTECVIKAVMTDVEREACR